MHSTHASCPPGPCSLTCGTLVLVLDRFLSEERSVVHDRISSALQSFFICAVDGEGADGSIRLIPEGDTLPSGCLGNSPCQIALVGPASEQYAEVYALSHRFLRKQKGRQGVPRSLWRSRFAPCATQRLVLVFRRCKDGVDNVPTELNS